MNTKKKKLAQIGTFDIKNYGDLLFPDLLAKVLSDYEIHLFSPKGKIKPFSKKIKVYPITALDKMCQEQKYQALIIGGGDLIRLDEQVASEYDVSMFSSLSLWLLPSVLGQKHNIPVIYNAPGAPYHFQNNVKSTINNILKNINYITVRDNESAEILNECGIENVRVVPDTIFYINEVFKKNYLDSIREQLISRNVIPNVNNYLIFQHNCSNINNKKYLTEIRKFLKYLTNELKYNVLLMPIGYIHKDIEFLSKVYNSNDNKQFLIEDEISPIEMLSVVSDSNGYIGTSMHGAITTYAYDKPIMMINVKRLVKVDGFLELVGLYNNQCREINNIGECFSSSFNNTTFHEHKKINKKIKCHFDFIKQEIEKSRNNLQINNYETDIIVSAFENLPQSSNWEFDNAKIYFDYGNGFSEDEMRILKLEARKDNITINIDIPKGVKNLRFDPIEGKYIMVQKLEIISASENYYKPIIPDKIDITNNEFFINSSDPKIIINNIKEEQIKIKMTARIIEYSEQHKIINLLNKNIHKLNLQIIEINKEYQNLRSKFLIKVILKIENWFNKIRKRPRQQ